MNHIQAAWRLKIVSAAVVLLLTATVQSLIAATASAQSSCSHWPAVITAPTVGTAIDPTPKVTVKSTSEADIVSAVEAIIEAGGGTLHFPAGEYTIPQKQRLGWPISILTFTDLDELKITGDGNSTVLRLARDPDFIGSNVHTIRVRGAERVEIADLRMIGVRSFVTPGSVPAIGEREWSEADPTGDAQAAHLLNEHQTHIYLRGIEKSSWVHDVYFRHAAGDGINIGGLRNVVLESNDFDDLGRNGITIGGRRGQDRSDGVLIVDNRFGGGIDTQQIDIELHSSGQSTFNQAHANRNIHIARNTFEEHNVVDTIDDDQWAVTFVESDGILFEGNVVHGHLHQFHAKNVVVANNTITGGIRVHHTSTVHLLSNTFFLRRHHHYGSGLEFSAKNGVRPSVVTLYGNHISTEEVGTVVEIENVDRSFVEDNTFVTPQQSPVLVRSSFETSRVNISGNSADVQTAAVSSGKVVQTEVPATCDYNGSPDLAPALANLPSTQPSLDPPTTRPLANLPSTQPSLDPPTTRPLANLPSTQPSLDPPTTRPLANLPSTQPSLDPPTTRPLANLPSTQPSLDPPTTRPLANLPSTQPSLDPPTTRPLANLPSTQPSLDPPTTRPLANLPSTQPSLDPPTTRPNVDVPSASPRRVTHSEAVLSCTSLLAAINALTDGWGDPGLPPHLREEQLLCRSDDGLRVLTYFEAQGTTVGDAVSSSPQVLVVSTDPTDVESFGQTASASQRPSQPMFLELVTEVLSRVVAVVMELADLVKGEFKG